MKRTSSRICQHYTH